jgi:hypothetical protein
LKCTKDELLKRKKKEPKELEEKGLKKVKIDS